MVRSMAGRGSGGAGLGAGLGQRVRRSLVGVGVAFWLIGAIAPAHAQGDPRPNADEAKRAISMLRSPYCPGFMLEVCPSPQAGALRDSIYDLAAQGMDSDALVEWMVGNHGEEWRGMPKMSGAGLWAWIIPPLALLLGIGALVGWMRSNRGTGPVREATDEPTMTSDEKERLAVALREWEESGREEV